MNDKNILEQHIEVKYYKGSLTFRVNNTKHGKRNSVQINKIIEDLL